MQIIMLLCVTDRKHGCFMLVLSSILFEHDVVKTFHFIYKKLCVSVSPCLRVHLNIYLLDGRDAPPPELLPPDEGDEVDREPPELSEPPELRDGLDDDGLETDVLRSGRL